MNNRFSSCLILHANDQICTLFLRQLAETVRVACYFCINLLYIHWQVIYRDFKASNVLLDKEFNPKLSDFGLAREGPTAGRSHVTTAVRVLRQRHYRYMSFEHRAHTSFHRSLESNRWWALTDMQLQTTSRRGISQSRATFGASGWFSTRSLRAGVRWRGIGHQTSRSCWIG